MIAETSWLILDRLGAASQVDFAMVTGRRLEAIDLTGEDWVRCEELLEQYADLRLDLMDASLIALAERLRATRVATLNHRDFRVVRPATSRRPNCFPERLVGPDSCWDLLPFWDRSRVLSFLGAGRCGRPSPKL